MIKKSFLLFFLLTSFVFAQNILYSVNDVVLRYILFISKQNYLERKLLLSTIEVSEPRKNSIFKQGDEIKISWNIDLNKKLTNTEKSDPEYFLGYYWLVSLYYSPSCSVSYCPEVLAKELGTIPLNSSNNYKFTYNIPLDLELRDRYFFKIELRNDFNRKILKTAKSEFFKLTSFPVNDRNFIKTNGYLIKLNKNIYEDFNYILFSFDKIYLIKTERDELESFSNKFINVLGRKLKTKFFNLEGIEVYNFSLVR